MSADAFKAVTWNVEYTTRVPELKPILKDVLDDGVSIILVQEVTELAVRQMFLAAGLGLFWVAPRYAVAWTDRWTASRQHGVHLAAATYRRRGGAEVVTKAAKVRLRDGADGKTLDAVSYQLPSSVQRADPLPGRLKVTRQSMATLRQLCKDSQLTGADACLFGGDDNVDERLHHGPWKFMLEAATGLKLTQAPEPTHAGGRKIDDFRTSGLVVGQGWVHRGGGDHKLHGRVFRWK